MENVVTILTTFGGYILAGISILVAAGVYVDKLNKIAAVIKDGMTEASDIKALADRVKSGSALVMSDLYPLVNNTFQGYDDIAAALGRPLMSTATKNAIYASIGYGVVPVPVLSDKAASIQAPTAPVSAVSMGGYVKVPQADTVYQSCYMSQAMKDSFTEGMTADQKESFLAQVSYNENLIKTGVNPPGVVYTVTVSGFGTLKIQNGEVYGESVVNK